MNKVIYKQDIYTKLLKLIQKKGNRYGAVKILNNTFKELKLDNHVNPFKVLDNCNNKILPKLSIKKVRKRNYTLEVPCSLTRESQVKQGLQLIAKSLKLNKNKSLKKELLDILNSKGNTVISKNRLHLAASSKIANLTLKK